MGLCPKPCLGDFLRRSPLRTFKTLNAIGFMYLFLRCTDFGVAVFRATNSGCSEPHSASGMRTFSLSPLPDRNGRKLVVSGGEMECGSFPTAYASAKCVSRRECNIVGNAPCVVPHRLKVTFFLPRTPSIMPLLYRFCVPLSTRREKRSFFVI